MTNSKLAQQVDAAIAAANPQPPRELTNEDRADHGRQLTAAYIAISPGLDTGDDETNATDAICEILHAIAADHGPDAAASALSMCSIHLNAELDEAAEAAQDAAEPLCICANVACSVNCAECSATCEHATPHAPRTHMLSGLDCNQEDAECTDIGGAQCHCIDIEPDADGTVIVTRETMGEDWFQDVAELLMFCAAATRLADGEYLFVPSL
jgi:hypothetical protein